MNRLVKYFSGALLLGLSLLTFPRLLEAKSAPQTDLAKLAGAQVSFGLQLYGQMRSNNLNLAVSPYGLYEVLAMACAGAQGNTAAQLLQAMQLPPGGTNLHRTFAELNRAVTSVNETNQLELNIANSVWSQKLYLLRPAFTSLLKTNYNAGVSPVDFYHGNEKARNTINAWVAEHTQRRLTNFFVAGSLSPTNSLLLLNTLFFKGAWREPFDPAATGEGVFHPTPKTASQARFMRHTASCLYLENRQCQVLALPYAGNKVELLVVLPRKSDGLAALEAGLKPALLASWLNDMKPREVSVSLPKLKFSARYPLNSNLVALGMKDAFEPGRANFAGIDGATMNLYISQVQQQVFVEIEEQGTVAAAATGMSFLKQDSSLSLPTFVANHPFLFVIREKATGAILFMGRVSDPALQ
jgi:serpin B